MQSKFKLSKSVLPWLINIKKAKSTKLSVTQQLSFFEGFASLLAMGFSIQQITHFLGIMQPKLADMMTNVNQELRAGHSLAESLKRFLPADLYYQLVIAEQHGQLLPTFQQLGQLLRVRLQQQRKLKQLLQYPIALLGLLVTLVMIVQKQVLPQLPASSNQITNWQASPVFKIAILLCLVFLVWIGSRWVKFRQSSKLVQANWQCRLPLIGGFWRCYYAYYVTFNVGLLFSGGLGLQAIVAVLQTYQSTALLRQLGAAFEKNVQAGQEINEFVRQSRLLPNELVGLVSKQADLKVLSQELLAFANWQYTELVRRSERAIALLQPCLLGVIALGTLGTYLSLLLPMYHSLEGIG